MPKLLLLVAGLVLLLTACGEPEPEPQNEIIIREAVMRESPPIEYYGVHGKATLEELIVTSPLIVQARFRSVRTVGIRGVYSLSSTHHFDGYIGALEFTFEVVEYLKGSGGDTVTGVAHGWPREGSFGVDAPTMEEAASLAESLLASRDKRWDDREAVVFLREVPTSFSIGLSQSADYYWLGELSVFPDDDAPGSSRPNRQVTVASPEAAVWLPDASRATSTPAGGSGPKSVEEQRFLLTEPAGGGGSGARSASSADSISLSSLTTLITKVEAEVAFGGGSDAYRDCLAKAYSQKRDKLVNANRFSYDVSLSSGLGAGTELRTAAEINEGEGVSLHVEALVFYHDTAVEAWFEGRDGYLLDFNSERHAYLKRPLPAGEYRMFREGRQKELVLCDGRHPAGKEELVVTVVAPDGTLAEAFFDPIESTGTGTSTSTSITSTSTTTTSTLSALATSTLTVAPATIGTTTIGVVSWEAGKVHAALTMDSTGHALDFIASDGSVSLSLAVADATVSDGVLTWPVAAPPWRAGDQLMLRVRSLP